MSLVFYVNYKSFKILCVPGCSENVKAEQVVGCSTEAIFVDPKVFFQESDTANTMVGTKVVVCAGGGTLADCPLYDKRVSFEGSCL